MSTFWLIGFAVAILIVVVVVVLLLGIIYQTRRIIQLATVASGTGRESRTEHYADLATKSDQSLYQRSS